MNRKLHVTIVTVLAIILMLSMNISAAAAPNILSTRTDLFDIDLVQDGLILAKSGVDIGPSGNRPSNGEVWNETYASWMPNLANVNQDFLEWTVAPGKGVDGGKGLSFEIKTDATDGWAYTNLNLWLSDPWPVDASDAKEIAIWVDFSEYAAGQNWIFFALGEFDYVDGVQSDVQEYWEPKPGTNAYYKDGDSYVTAEIDANKQFALPEGYVGWVRWPLTSTRRVSWQDGSETNLEFDGKSPFILTIYVSAPADNAGANGYIGAISTFSGNVVSDGNVEATPTTAPTGTQPGDPFSATLVIAGLSAIGIIVSKKRIKK